jgi:hypothetical protein
MRPTVGSVTGVVYLNTSPFGQLPWNIFSGNRGRYLSIDGVWAAPRHNQINELSGESGVDSESPFWVQHCILRVYYVLLTHRLG